ncbi:MAG: geranyl transferase [Gammaproteobacteria bacterium]|nr:geranyl transferase [Gammaproteobacteria bacterium]|tara:strand:- start:2198 stop:3067 length:870 start_codon:yes stop_codon:yes gene_type:complete
MNLEEYIKENTATFDAFLQDFLSINLTNHSAKLLEAMNYSLLNGGKRIRPLLVMAFAQNLDIKKEYYMNVALAVEFVHTYSLIHDDIMDDDDFRRGQLATHKKFDIPTAMLAGNSLLTWAFQILSDESTHPNTEVRNYLTGFLSSSSGHTGLAYGQSLDLEYQFGNKNADYKKILKMHDLKTARLFKFCTRAPFVLCNPKILLNNKKTEHLDIFGTNFGLIFQATDDLLDYRDLDKSVDLGNIMSYKNNDEVVNYCKKLAKEALASLKNLEIDSQVLTELIQFIIIRKS